MLDPDLLACFSVVVECGSFTRAAQRLNTVQSAVSAKVKRLEERAGRQLLERTTRGMTLTPDGEAMLAFARDMTRLQDSARLRFSAPSLEGVVRLGTSDDIASGGRMTPVLAQFAALYPKVSLEVDVGDSVGLAEDLRVGRLDIVLSKRRAAKGGGRLLWAEPIVWMGGKTHAASWDGTVPLAMFPAPCFYHEAMIAALIEAGRAWRAVLTASSLAGIKATVAAGLAVTALPQSQLSPELVVIQELPPMSPVEFILHIRPRAPKAALVLADLLGGMSP